MPPRLTEIDIRELELPPLPSLGGLVPPEQRRDFHADMQEYARKALEMHLLGKPAPAEPVSGLLTQTIAQYVADHCVDGESHARVILGMAQRLGQPAPGGREVTPEQADRWRRSQAVAVAHASGFAGTCWTMGPEELAHLLGVAGVQPASKLAAADAAAPGAEAASSEKQACLLSQASEKKAVWVAYTNTDCTEGRGQDVPIAVCALEATAMRLARGRYVQGTDGPVRPLELVSVDGKWYAPTATIDVIEPTPADMASQAVLDTKRQAVAKAKAAGLTDEDLRALGVSPDAKGAH